MTYPQQQKPQIVPQQNPQNPAQQTQPQPQQKSKGKKEVDYSQKSVRELANLLGKIEKDKEKIKADILALKNKGIALNQKGEQIAKILTQKLAQNG